LVLKEEARLKATNQEAADFAASLQTLHTIECGYEWQSKLLNTVTNRKPGNIDQINAVNNSKLNRKVSVNSKL
jgi:hypothetical protein